jgi:hypothetical protein
MDLAAAGFFMAWLPPILWDQFFDHPASNHVYRALRRTKDRKYIGGDIYTWSGQRAWVYCGGTWNYLKK